MGVSDSLRVLAGFLDEHDVSNSVTTVEYGSRTRRDGTPILTATFDRQLAVGTDEEPTALPCSDLSVDSDGNLQCTLELEALVDAPTNVDIDVEPTGITVDSAGVVSVTLAASLSTGHPPDKGVPTAPGAGATAASPAESTGDELSGELRQSGETKQEPSRGDGEPGEAADDESPVEVDPASPEHQFEHYDEDIPPFRNPDLLAEVYEACDTFAEMTDALGMDVTAETVRRYMVDYDIHQPNSYNTSGSADADDEGPDEPASAEPVVDSTPADELDSPALIADGIGLPEDVTIESLIGIVKSSNTIYEVKQDIGMDRADALEMLRELNLLDLVVGRLATESDRDIRREEIVERLRTVAAQ